MTDQDRVILWEIIASLPEEKQWELYGLLDQIQRKKLQQEFVTEATNIVFEILPNEVK